MKPLIITDGKTNATLGILLEPESPMDLMWLQKYADKLSEIFNVEKDVFTECLRISPKEN